MRKSEREFFDMAEDMVVSIFRSSGGWNAMAVAMLPGGVDFIQIPSGRDDVAAAAMLKSKLLMGGASAYAAAYLTVKSGSPAIEEEFTAGNKALDLVSGQADEADLASAPDKVLFIFMSGPKGGRIRAYGVDDRNELGGRISWLEDSESPFHGLLAA